MPRVGPSGGWLIRRLWSMGDGPVPASVQVAGAQQDPAAQNVHAAIPASR
jgi:hypothetical protein